MKSKIEVRSATDDMNIVGEGTKKPISIQKVKLLPSKGTTKLLKKSGQTNSTGCIKYTGAKIKLKPTSEHS